MSSWVNTTLAISSNRSSIPLTLYTLQPCNLSRRLMGDPQVHLKQMLMPVLANPKAQSVWAEIRDAKYFVLKSY